MGTKASERLWLSAMNHFTGTYPESKRLWRHIPSSATSGCEFCSGFEGGIVLQCTGSGSKECTRVSHLDCATLESFLALQPDGNLLFTCTLHTKPLLYCTCQQPYSANEAMVGCDECGEWYHISCLDTEFDISVNELTATEKKFICPSCSSILATNDASKLALLSDRKQRNAEKDSLSACQQSAKDAVGAYLRVVENVCPLIDLLAKTGYRHKGLGMRDVDAALTQLDKAAGSGTEQGSDNTDTLRFGAGPIIAEWLDLLLAVRTRFTEWAQKAQAATVQALNGLAPSRTLDKRNATEARRQEQALRSFDKEVSTIHCSPDDLAAWSSIVDGIAWIAELFAQRDGAAHDTAFARAAAVSAHVRGLVPKLKRLQSIAQTDVHWGPQCAALVDLLQEYSKLAKNANKADEVAASLDEENDESSNNRAPRVSSSRTSRTSAAAAVTVSRLVRDMYGEASLPKAHPKTLGSEKPPNRAIKSKSHNKIATEVYASAELCDSCTALLVAKPSPMPALQLQQFGDRLLTPSELILARAHEQRLEAERKEAEEREAEKRLISQPAYLTATHALPPPAAPAIASSAASDDERDEERGQEIRMEEATAEEYDEEVDEEDVGEEPLFAHEEGTAETDVVERRQASPGRHAKKPSKAEIAPRPMEEVPVSIDAPPDSRTGARRGADDGSAVAVTGGRIRKRQRDEEELADTTAVALGGVFAGPGVILDQAWDPRRAAEPKVVPLQGFGLDGDGKQTIVILMSISSNASGFALNITPPNPRDQFDILLHFNPRYGKGEIVLNDKQGTWGEAFKMNIPGSKSSAQDGAASQRSGLLSSSVELTIQVLQDGFAIFANNTFTSFFAHRRSPATLGSLCLCFPHADDMARHYDGVVQKVWWGRKDSMLDKVPPKHLSRALENTAHIIASPAAPRTVEVHGLPPHDNPVELHHLEMALQDMFDQLSDVLPEAIIIVPRRGIGYVRLESVDLCAAAIKNLQGARIEDNQGKVCNLRLMQLRA